MARKIRVRCLLLHSVVVVAGIDVMYGLNLAGKTTLAETAAILKKAVVMVSGDSGVLHLAAGVGCRTVSLFGPGIE